MNRIEWLNHIEQVIAQGPFEASMESLKNYKVPSWYETGKFGLFIHWGVYSVPAYESEWYPRLMYHSDQACYKHHIDTYGAHKDFGYKDFIPMFKAEKFDPEDWAELFEESGAKFIVPVSEHHDGFQMYDCTLSRWNSVNMGPKKDICGLIKQSVEARGMVFGGSNHRAEHYWFMDGMRKFDSGYCPELEDLYGPAQPAPVNWHSLTEAAPTATFLDDWLAHICEFVDAYRPRLIWFDWWINHMAFRPYLEKFAAFYYNRAAEWGIEVAINYKYEAYEPGAAVFDVERGQLADGAQMLWQNDTSVSKNSWGYISNHDYKKTIDILCDLADIVSKRGALLLNIGPKPDGTIPEPERVILKEIGAWMRRNGEAIYGTSPWRVYGEGPTQIPEGAFTDTNRDAFTGADIRYTAKDGALYAIVLGMPEGKVVLKQVKPSDGFTKAKLMGGCALEVCNDADGLGVLLPSALDMLPLVIKLER